MTLNIRDLAEQLEISDQELDDLKKQIVKSFEDEKIVRDILSRQLSDREETHCLSCDNEGDCFILNGIIHLRLKENEKAIKELENANWHLRSKNETWNSIIGLVLLGIALEEFGKNYLALREYKKAYETLTNNFLRIHVNDQTEKASQLKNELLEKLKELSAPNLSAAPPSQTDSGNTNSNPSSMDDKDYLALFSIPIYEEVEAGPNGPVWAEHLEIGKTEVRRVVLENKYYKIYSTKYSDRRVTVLPDRKFAWAKVHGQSMNTSHPVPINEEDYVLFYQANSPKKNEIVIAAKADNSDGSTYMVKRYLIDEKLLESETSEQGELYNPIPITADYRIIGIVVAIAKPV